MRVRCEATKLDGTASVRRLPMQNSLRLDDDRQPRWLVFPRNNDMACRSAMR